MYEYSNGDEPPLTGQGNDREDRAKLSKLQVGCGQNHGSQKTLEKPWLAQLNDVKKIWLRWFQTFFHIFI